MCCKCRRFVADVETKCSGFRKLFGKIVQNTHIDVDFQTFTEICPREVACFSAAPVGPVARLPLPPPTAPVRAAASPHDLVQLISIDVI